MLVSEILSTTRQRTENMIDMVKSKVESFTDVVVDSIGHLDKRAGRKSSDVILTPSSSLDRLAKRRSIADAACMEVSCYWSLKDVHS